jgi:O-antigen/teichoic acid export membrane protein
MKTGTGKPKPRPTRLVRFSVEFDASTWQGDEGGIVMKEHFVANIVGETSDIIQGDMLPPPTTITQMTAPLGEAEAQLLLRRTPASYLLNQLYGLWIFISLFILTLIMTRKVSIDQYGVYAIAATAFNTIAYIVAFGLEDATNTFVPRILAEHGLAAAAQLIRRLLALRIVTLVVTLGIMLFALPYVAVIFAAIPLPTFGDIAKGLRDPGLLGHITPIAFWVFGNGIASLLTAVYASIMRMRIVFIVGSLTQLLLLGLSFVTLRLGWGIDSVLWLNAICAIINAAVFALWQAQFIFTRGATYKQPLRPVARLGISAWFTNLVSGALLKQVSVILLTYFAVSVSQIAFFTLSFQLAHAASLLLVSGFGGVGISALAAAFVGMNYQRLARSWQTLIKIETLLAAPILIFCLFNAPVIAVALYGSNYSTVGPLLGIFLLFNVIVRVLGTTIHQSTLYVLQKPRLVVLAQLAGLVVLIPLGILLIPHFGPAGALVADGISQLLTGALMLAFLWRDLPEKYPLSFTLRMLLALTIAALPAIVWHPSGRIMLIAAGIVFLVLAIGFLVLIKPLSAADMQMIGEMRPGVVRYLKWFVRGERQ